MDFFTHLLLPYAAALVALGLHKRAVQEDRSRLASAAVFGIAAASPDTDGLLSWLADWNDSFYFLQHRGVSHTLVGAPLYALAVVLFLAWLARVKPRTFGLFRWRPVFVPLLVAGSWMHLILDYVTLSGVPLLWPFAWGRATLNLFHWVVWWLFPVCGAILALHAWGRLSPRGVVRAAAVVTVVLVVLAGIRVGTRPALADDEQAFPRPSMFEWTVVRPVGGSAWEARLVRVGGVVEDAMTFRTSVPDAARDAVERARAHPSYLGWRMETYGPLVVTASPLAGGGWNVSFVDVAARFEALHEPTWTPARPFHTWGIVSFDVRGNEVVPTLRGW